MTKFDRAKEQTGWIGVDLDGTLAEYFGLNPIEHIGNPVPLMVERVRKWLSEGRDVRIFTARVAGGESTIDLDTGKSFSADHARNIIQDWTEKHFGVRLPVTNQKDYGMIELWDDRAVQVILNTGKRADGESDDC